MWRKEEILSVKFGCSEKATKFEKNLPLRIDDMCSVAPKNERRNHLIGKYIADFYFVHILSNNNKKM